jgi:biopolymer transport protein ExbD
MRHVTTVLGSVALLVVLAPAGAQEGGEKKVELDKVPKAVREAVKKRFPKAKVTAAAQEGEAGKKVYEVTLKQDGKNIDVTIKPDGTIELIEKEIAFSDLPKAVSASLEKKYPEATYKIIEEVIKVEGGKETLSYYEALLVTKGKKTLEVEVGLDGAIKKETPKDAKEKDS